MRVQKRLAVFGLLVSTCLFGTGCQTTDNSNAVTGGVFGAGLGALTGAIVGSAFGRRDAAAGALIGAAAGGVGGALIGHSQDERNDQNAKAAQAQYQQAQAAAEQAALTNADIVYMVRSGLSAEVVVNSIRSRGGRFDTTPDAIVQLKANGVSDYLIQVMQTTPAPSATVLPAGQVVYGPPPGPAVGVYVAPRPYWGWGYRGW
jgi:outer membrane lipoprotein SlyB